MHTMPTKMPKYDFLPDSLLDEAPNFVSEGQTCLDTGIGIDQNTTIDAAQENVSNFDQNDRLPVADNCEHPKEDHKPTKTGRPSGYSTKLAEIICERIGNGESLIKICTEKGMPAQSMVYRWLKEYSEFREQYAYARDNQADFYAEEIISIADSSKGGTSDDVQSARLRSDARKWAASKLNPKKYGDKLDVSGSIEVSNQDPLDLGVALKLANLLQVWRDRAIEAGESVPVIEIPGPLSGQ